MTILIIEDEKLAAEHLQKLIEKVIEGAKIMKVIDSVKKSCEWLVSNPTPDIIFMDIQLSDGLSFEIFEKTLVKSPVIFTTAYDEFAIKAFKVNSVDYLLKPIDADSLQKAYSKYKLLYQNGIDKGAVYKIAVDKVLKAITNKYKERFVIKVGDHIRTVATDDIHFFYSLEKSTYLQTSTGKHYDIDYTLDILEDLIDMRTFFRVNRKYIVSFSSIQDIIAFTNSRLKLKLQNCTDDEVIVSRERVGDFKQWLDR